MGQEGVGVMGGKVKKKGIRSGNKENHVKLLEVPRYMHIYIHHRFGWNSGFGIVD